MPVCYYWSGVGVEKTQGWGAICPYCDEFTEVSGKSAGTTAETANCNTADGSTAN